MIHLPPVIDEVYEEFTYHLRSLDRVTKVAPIGESRTTGGWSPELEAVLVEIGVKDGVLEKFKAEMLALEDVEIDAMQLLADIERRRTRLRAKADDFRSRASRFYADTVKR